MLGRFCLYSFLKDQRFIEPFLMLALAERDWSFAGMGVLLGLREAVVAVFEVPTGFLADAIGYRRTLVVAFLCCMTGYGMLGASAGWILCGVSVVALGIGEACRTGVHKAMILNWLAQHNLADASARFYGFTRSWGEIGAGVSVLLAAAFVYSGDTYQPLFFATIVPFLLNIVNVSTYPKEVEPNRQPTRSTACVRVTAPRNSRSPGTPVLRILTQSIAFDSLFRSTKHFVQPAIELTTAALLVSRGMSRAEATPKSVALVAVPVYVLLHSLSAIASRQAHRASTLLGGAEPAMRMIWVVVALCYLLTALGDQVGTPAIIVGAFVLLHSLQNLWRPLVISELSKILDPSCAASWLSGENLLRRIGAAAVFPLMGFLVDWASRIENTNSLLPVGIIGCVASMVFVAARKPTPTETADGDTKAQAT